jgi:hypothetical protein
VPGACPRQRLSGGSDDPFRCESEAPNVFMPITSPSGPTYAAQPNVEACSTATRAVIAGGRTLWRYASGWCSKSSHDAMLTTRARTPSAVSSS